MATLLHHSGGRRQAFARLIVCFSLYALLLILFPSFFQVEDSYKGPKPTFPLTHSVALEIAEVRCRRCGMQFVIV